MATNDHHPLPYMTRFPGYDPSKNWHGNDPILSSITLAELNHGGFINLPAHLIPTNPRYHPSKPAVVFKSDTTISTTDPEDRKLHPVLRRANFPNIDDRNYELLKPVLKLTTDMLNRPELLSFFKGLLGDGYPIDDPLGEKRLKRKLRGFQPEVITDRKEIEGMHILLGKLGGCVVWAFGGEHGAVAGSTWAYTESRRERPSGCVHEGTSSIVYLRPEFLAVMNGTVVASHIDPDIDDASALLRARLFMARTMIHETAHAFYNAFHSYRHKLEPFMGDDWIAEVGHALEMWLFGGVIYPIGQNPCHPGSPFGLFHHRFPDSDAPTAWAMARMSMARAGIKRQTYYALNMHWIRRIFFTNYWTTDMNRYGWQLLRLPKTLGVRLKVVHQRWEGEGSPRWANVSPNGTVRSMEAERVVFDVHSMWPDAEEGVLRPDGVGPLGEDAATVARVIEHGARRPPDDWENDSKSSDSSAAGLIEPFEITDEMDWDSDSDEGRTVTWGVPAVPEIYDEPSPKPTAAPPPGYAAPSAIPLAGPPSPATIMPGTFGRPSDAPLMPIPVLPTGRPSGAPPPPSTLRTGTFGLPSATPPSDPRLRDIRPYLGSTDPRGSALKARGSPFPRKPPHPLSTTTTAAPKIPSPPSAPSKPDKGKGKATIPETGSGLETPPDTPTRPTARARTAGPTTTPTDPAGKPKGSGTIRLRFGRGSTGERTEEEIAAEKEEEARKAAVRAERARKAAESVAARTAVAKARADAAKAAVAAAAKAAAAGVDVEEEEDEEEEMGDPMDLGE